MSPIFSGATPKTDFWSVFFGALLEMLSPLAGCRGARRSYVERFSDIGTETNGPRVTDSAASQRGGADLPSSRASVTGPARQHPASPPD